MLTYKMIINSEQVSEEPATMTRSSLMQPDGHKAFLLWPQADSHIM